MSKEPWEIFYELFHERMGTAQLQVDYSEHHEEGQHLVSALQTARESVLYDLALARHWRVDRSSELMNNFTNEILSWLGEGNHQWVALRERLRNRWADWVLSGKRT